MGHTVIHLHPAAPAKPPVGAACNGCGVCCAWAPCPLGVLLSRRLRGPCTALRWDGERALYRCAAVQPRPGQPPRAARRLLAWLAARWIAAGVGCDCSLDARPG